MRILTIHDDCSAPGGSNAYRRRLNALLKKRGIEVYLFTQSINATSESEESPYYCYRYPGGVRFLRHVERFYFNPTLVAALRRYIRSVKPHLIHIHHCYQFPASVLTACRGVAPVVQTVHDFRIFCVLQGVQKEIYTPDGARCERCLGGFCFHQGHAIWQPFFSVFREKLPRRFLRGLMREAVDLFIAPSRAIEKPLKDFSPRTFFLPHFVDCRRYPVTPLKRDRQTVLFAGYLDLGKGVQVLLKAFARVAKKICGASLDIVGAGPYGEELKRLCGSLGLENHVRFHGWLSPEMVGELMMGAGVVVLPSLFLENSPLVIYEAMACCRPVVASRAGGIPELVSDGVNGYLFTRGDKQELAEKLIELLMDRNKGEAMGRAGRAIAESQFSPERHLERYMELAENLVSAGTD